MLVSKVGRKGGVPASGEHVCIKCRGAGLFQVRHRKRTPEARLGKMLDDMMELSNSAFARISGQP
jgi:hypothetical protein